MFSKFAESLFADQSLRNVGGCEGEELCSVALDCFLVGVKEELVGRGRLELVKLLEELAEFQGGLVGE